MFNFKKNRIMWLYYFVGVIVTMLYLIVWEKNVDHENLKEVTVKEWIEDSLVSLTSWLGLVLCIIVTIYKLNGGSKIEK